MRSFDELVAEAEAAPITGWDFSWLDGRATEERPPWRYAEQVAARAASVASMLDLQSGGGEMLATLPSLPPLMVASEGYAPNVAVAARNLRPRGACVVAAHDDRSALPFADATFELVTSRHPIETYWDEIARVLQRGGSYFSQQVGPHTMRELSEFFLGARPNTSKHDLALAACCGTCGACGATTEEGATARDVRRGRRGRLLPPARGVASVRLQRRALPGAAARPA